MLVPLVYSLPEILIIGELASMLPLEGGYYRWVQRAFGPFWAFQNGWLTWMYSLVDMAIYPKLFVTYLAWFAPDLPSWGAWVVGLMVIWGASAVNLAGAGRVGRTSVFAGTVHHRGVPRDLGRGAGARLPRALASLLGARPRGGGRDGGRSVHRALDIAKRLGVAGIAKGGRIEVSGLLAIVEIKSLTSQIGARRNKRTDRALGGRVVSNVERQARGFRIDKVNAPAARNLIERCVRDRKMTVLAEWQVVRDRERVVKWLVVAGNSAVARNVIEVDARVVAIVVLEMAGSVIDRLRPSERIDEVEAQRVALFELCLQGVVAAEAAVKRFFDGGEV